MIIELIITFVVPVFLSVSITPWVIKLANSINAVDNPGGRKIHMSVTPRLGGLAIVASFIISLFLLYSLFPHLFESLNVSLWKIGTITSCFMGIFLLGFWDDLKTLNPGLKFSIQFIIAALIYFSGFQISNITNPVGAGMLNVEMIDFPLTILWIVGVTNAFNLIDGLDGLASGVATIACISIFTVSILESQIITAILALAMAGALIGFLRYNFNPAKIFLGDSGSLSIGFGLALLSIQSTTKISTGFSLLFPLLVLGLPITDTIISMLRRFLGGFMPERTNNAESIGGKLYHMFTPDSSHIHHQLLSLGLSHRNTVLLLYSVSAFFAISAFVITQITTLKTFVIVASLFAIAFVVAVKKLQYREIAIFNNGIMLPIYERWILNRFSFLSLIDLAFIVLSFSLSYGLINNIASSGTVFANFEEILLITVSIQLFTFWITGLYRETIKQMGIGTTIRITASVAYAVIGTAAAFLMMDALTFNLGLQFLVHNFYFLLTFILGIRIAYQVFNYWFHKEKNSGDNVLIYGANANGTMILNKLINSPDTDFKVIGFLDDDQFMEGKLIHGYPILGGHWKLKKTLQEMNIDYIFICEEDIKPENFNRLKNQAHKHQVEIKQLQVRLKKVVSDNKEEEETMVSQMKDQSITYI